MYACVCNALRDRDIDRAIDEGASSLGHLFAKNRCRAQCGSCFDYLRDRLRTCREAAFDVPETSSIALESGFARNSAERPEIA